MYKSPDFRCLKPNSSTPTAQWSHYEMTGYRESKTKQELENVMEIPFDKYFFNFEDPTVWKEMTDPEKGIAIWKRTYGFDFGALTQGLGGNANTSECQQHCLEAEYGDFAKKCQKNGGFFKCCILGYDKLNSIGFKSIYLPF